MKSLFILSFILSCSASNFLIYDLPADHFDVAYGTDRPSSEFGHFHAYVEVRTERTQRDDEFWVKTQLGNLRPGQIRQNFIQPHGTYYFDENENAQTSAAWYKVNMWLPHGWRNNYCQINFPEIERKRVPEGLLTDEDPYQ